MSWAAVVRPAGLLVTIATTSPTTAAETQTNLRTDRKTGPNSRTSKASPSSTADQ